jgi:hypothetical protein
VTSHWHLRVEEEKLPELCSSQLDGAGHSFLACQPTT